MLSNSAESFVDYHEIETTHGDDATYLEALGLYVNPFTQIPDEKFYVESPAIKQRMQTLVHMIGNNNALICVLSDEGGGKTTFLRKFSQEVSAQWRPHEVSVSKKMTAVQLLNDIARSIGASVLKKESRQLNKIIKHVTELNENNYSPVILFDNGHLLSAKTFSVLLKLNLRISDKKLKLSTVVFADHEIKNTLNHKSIKNLLDDWVYSIHLPRLSKKDTAEYLQHRLTTAGMFIDEPFKTADINAIYKESKGLPRKINEIAHRILISNYGDDCSSSLARPGWLDKVKGICNGNKTYIVMSLALSAALISVVTGERHVDTVSTVVAQNVQVVSDVSGVSNNSAGLSAGLSAGRMQTVASRSLLSSSTDSDCDTKIFLDCGKPIKDAIKVISYK